MRNFSPILLLLISCSTLPKQTSSPGPLQFEKIQLGTPAKDVASFVGQPAEIRKGNEKDPDDLWIYHDETGAQTGAVSVATKDQSVTGITVVPRETDPEYRLSHLLKKKYASFTFEKAPLQRCRRDFVPLEIFYIEPKEGLIIEANRRTEEVGSFSRTTSEFAADLLGRIKACER